MSELDIKLLTETDPKQVSVLLALGAKVVSINGINALNNRLMENNLEVFRLLVPHVDGWVSIFVNVFMDVVMSLDDKEEFINYIIEYLNKPVLNHLLIQMMFYSRRSRSDVILLYKYFIRHYDLTVVLQQIVTNFEPKDHTDVIELLLRNGYSYEVGLYDNLQDLSLRYFTHDFSKCVLMSLNMPIKQQKIYIKRHYLHEQLCNEIKCWYKFKPFSEEYYKALESFHSLFY